MNKQRALWMTMAAGAVLAAVPPLVGQVQIGRTRTEIVGVSKNITGIKALVRDAHLACPDGQRIRAGTFTINEAAVTSGDCDEDCSITSLNGTFSATIKVVHRNNPEQLLTSRGRLEGRWQIRNQGRLVASGKLVGTLNTDADGEDAFSCSPDDYFEGVLEGRSVARDCRGPITATIRGSGLNPDDVDDQGRGEFTLHVEGMAVVPCPVKR